MTVSIHRDNRATGATAALRTPVPRPVCTDCGVSRMAQPSLCASVCQFIKPDYPALERKVHGVSRAESEAAQATHFGPYKAMHRARLKAAREGAQWTGLTTELAAAALREGAVDAVLTVRADTQDRWKPQPVLVTDPAALAACRGMRMGYAPLLALLEEAQARGLKRLAVIGIPCQVHALRAMQDSLGFDEIVVIGTPCSDNTTTQNFHRFLAELTDTPQAVTYLEFRADYHVEMRFADGETRLIPFLKLPLSRLPADFFPLPCRTCVDYTNALADITVGYMAGEGDQWLLVRNERGQSLLDRLGDAVELGPVGTGGRRAGSVRGFIANTARAAGGMPARAMPDWLRPLVAWLMPKVGPRGLEFALARVEMKAAETVLHLRRRMPRRMKAMVPEHVWTLVEPYGLTPEVGERPAVRDDTGALPPRRR